MDHETVIETIEIAAAEPGGLDRLMAGDTPASQAVAGHVAGCSTCADAVGSLAQDVAIVADVVSTTPHPALRATTLTFVQANGVDRGRAEGLPGSATEPARSRRPLLWVASIAATVLIAVSVTGAVLYDRANEQLAAQADVVDDLEHVTIETMAIAAAPDAVSVVLDGVADDGQRGSVLFSPSTTELVVVATGLVEPPPNQEFACWMDTGDRRIRIGKMFFGGDLAYWVGPSPAVAGLDSSATFGVSLVAAGSADMAAPPVLLGRS